MDVERQDELVSRLGDIEELLTDDESAEIEELIDQGELDNAESLIDELDWERG